MRVNLSLCLTATTDILNPFFMSVFFSFSVYHSKRDLFYWKTAKDEGCSTWASPENQEGNFHATSYCNLYF